MMSAHALVKVSCIGHHAGCCPLIVTDRTRSHFRRQFPHSWCRLNVYLQVWLFELLTGFIRPSLLKSRMNTRSPKDESNADEADIFAQCRQL
jgi:hypothetical protein